jgi:5'-nucleotidase
MTFPIEDKLVVAIASSALFDLTESGNIFRTKGEEAYRRYQRDNENVILQQGVAFPLIRRLLKLNQRLIEEPVEVVLLSRNDPDTGLRVFNSIEYYHLPISRAAFVGGGNPFRYVGTFNAALFLSANADDVRRAIERGLPAGRVFPTHFADREEDVELRIAFDFDGVLADDAAESVFKRHGLQAFFDAETQQSGEPHHEGPIHRFFREIARLQQLEKAHIAQDPSYSPQLRTAIITARNAPAHKRVVTTLRSWGIEVDEVFFLGGIDKRRVLQEFQPHIFFDDQLQHIEGAAGVTPCVHVPFGVANEPSPESVLEAYQEHERRARNAIRPNRSESP